jgi:hypothetical protein
MSALDGVGGQTHAHGRFTAGEGNTVPTLLEDGWTPRPVWTGAENLALTGNRSVDHPARSASLCRLRYPVPQLKKKDVKISGNEV